MANEQILVRAADGAPHIYSIDPNAIRKDGDIVPRYINQEDLMIYVEVRAFMNPKVKYIEYSEPPVGDENSDIITITKGIFYSSTNALNDDKSFKTKLTTDWTDMYDAKRPFDIEGLGINNIDIDFNASLVPKIHIEFIDVRGKNLLERGDSPDNPYNVFYTFPYPMFELIVKGYFGKAIRIPMIMQKAITRFDPSSGSYVISADFTSFTFAILNDLILLYAMIVPYMYPTKTAEGKDDFEGNILIQQKFNNIDGRNNRILVKDLFYFNEKIAKLFSNTLKEKAMERTFLTDAVIKSIKIFQEEIEYLAKNRNVNNESELQKRIITALNTINSNKMGLDKLGYSEVNNWDFTGIKFDNFWKDNPTAVVPMTSEQYMALVTPINEFITKQARLDMQTLKKDLISIGFYPTIENVVKAIVIHMDAFMELLRIKTRAVMNSLKIDGNEKDIMECIELKDGGYKRLPWPEFYKQAPKPTNTAGTIIVDGVELVKEYPGASDDQEVRNWGEVEFIEEMYKAINLLNVNLNLNRDDSGNLVKEIFIVSPLSVPINDQLYTTAQNTPDDIFNHIMAQLLILIYHNGMLYRQTDDQVRRSEEGVYGYFIKNMVENLFPINNLPNNAHLTIGALKSKCLEATSAFADTMKKMLNDTTAGSTAINTLIQEMFKKQDNKIVGNHSYFLNIDRLPTEYIRKHYLETNSKTSTNQVPRLSPMRLQYNIKALEVLPIFNFNESTFVNGQATNPLIFSNSYMDDDMFITRKYD